MKDQVAIRLTNVSKDFLLPHEKVDSVKGVFVNPFRSRQGMKKIEHQHALKNVSFEVKKGEFFGIVGRNGSGKSTLLKIIASIYKPTKGSVEVDGRLVPFIELGVGFNPELTGRENTYLNGALLGFSATEVDEKYDAIVEFAELDRFMDQKLKNYSSGMQVRLAFSVATILADSEILLIDEVLAVGDADFQRKCFTYFKRLKKEGKTVVFVTHDMSAVREYCDRAVLIDNNHIVRAGDANEIAKEYDKLFLQPDTDSAAQDKSDEKRWGNGDVVTVSLVASTAKDQIVITQTIKAIKNVHSPIVGIRIKNATGREVTGTNTRIEHKSTGDIKAGETVTVTWSFKDVLAEGMYTIDPAILLEDGITTADWWDDASELTIKKRFLPYDIDPGFTVKIGDSRE